MLIYFHSFGLESNCLRLRIFPILDQEQMYWRCNHSWWSAFEHLNSTYGRSGMCTVCASIGLWPATYQSELLIVIMINTDIFAYILLLYFTINLTDRLTFISLWTHSIKLQFELRKMLYIMKCLTIRRNRENTIIQFKVV